MPNIKSLAFVVAEKSATKVFVSDGRTDGRKDRAKTVYPPLLRSGGIIKGLVILHKRTRLRNGLTSRVCGSSWFSFVQSSFHLISIQDIIIVSDISIFWVSIFMAFVSNFHGFACAIFMLWKCPISS